MNINTSRISFGTLVPLSEYKGPVLKLTKAEKAKIKIYNEKIMDLQAELSKINHYANKSPSAFDYYASVIQKLMARINELKDLIQEIKLKRFNKQKERFNKKA